MSKDKIEFSTGRSSSHWSRQATAVAHFSTGLKKRLQPHCNEFGHRLEPTKYARNEAYPSPGLEWMHMEEYQLECAATGGGGMGTDVTNHFNWRRGAEFLCSSG